MKKLIMAFIAMSVVTVANATALSWRAYGALNEGGSDEDWFSGGQAYLILVSDTSAFSVAQDLKIKAGSVVHSADIEGGIAESSIDGSEIGLVDGSTYQFAVLFTTEGKAGTKMPTSGLYGMNDNNGGFYSVTWNEVEGSGFVTGGTYATVIFEVKPTPEPTSGLLLLLGMAGLALKRKRV